MKSIAISVLCAALLHSSGLAQSSTPVGTVSTYAGPSLPIDGAAATTQAIDYPSAVIPDGSGGFFVSSLYQNRIYRIVSDGTLRTVAGSGGGGFSGDGGPATSAQLNHPAGLARDAAGNLFIVDARNHRIRKVNSAGSISTVAGNGTPGFSGDGGPATRAQLNSPWGVALDAAGNLFIADSINNRIRKVTSAGVITTVAGNGRPGFSGDNGPAIDAQLNIPSSVAVNATGTLFISDDENHRIRKVTPAGTITTVVGTGTRGFAGDGGPAVSAQLSTNSVTVDAAGNLFIADRSNHRVRKVTAAGLISTVAGNGVAGFSGDGRSATSAQLDLPTSVAIDSTGNLFIADSYNHRIRKVTPAGIIGTVAGIGTATGPITNGFRGDGGRATAALLNDPESVAVDSAGNVFIADVNNSRIRKITPAGIISTVAGSGVSGYSGNGDTATSALLYFPKKLAVDARGNIFIAEEQSLRIRKVTPQGIITTVAGNGTAGFSGDGGPATAAQLTHVLGVAVDKTGNLFIADVDNNRIRRVDAAGVITTVAGNGTSGFSGDDGPAIVARLSSPRGVAVDATGNLFIADTGNHRIRKVTPAGVITTIAGIGRAAFGGDGGPAVSAAFYSPSGVAIDGAGNLLIADTYNNRIRKVNVEGTVTTVAGNGVEGFGGDGGPAISSSLSFPNDIAVDVAGNLLIADTGNERIRKVTGVGVASGNGPGAGPGK